MFLAAFGVILRKYTYENQKAQQSTKQLQVDQPPDRIIYFSLLVPPILRFDNSYHVSVQDWRGESDAVTRTFPPRKGQWTNVSPLPSFSPPCGFTKKVRIGG